MALIKITEDTLQAAQGYDSIRFVFTDINGIPRCKNALKGNIEKYLKKGIDLFYGTISMGPQNQMNFDLPGIKESNLGNMTITPASDKIHPLPWASERYKVGEIICETFHQGEPQPMNPRTVCRKQIRELNQLGFSLLSAFECEFMLTQLEGGSGPLFPHHVFATCSTVAQYEEFVLGMVEQMNQAGIEPDLLQCEYAGGQIEMSLAPRRDLCAADMTFRFKQAVKEISVKRKFARATFMTKPNLEPLCNGMHFNHSLWDVEGKSALYDAGREDKLTDVGRWWLAGLVKHAPAITALCCPTVNCYRRLHIPWSPSKPNWGLDNRNCAIRAKNAGAEGTYFENRLPSAAANPYICVAATIAAGIDGVRNKLELPAQADQTRPDLPHSLEEALQTLQQDHQICDAIGKEFIEWFVPIKQENEINKFKDHNMKDNNGVEIEKERAEYFQLF